ncbi:LysR family transcriptional regulator [Agrobacterium radiobacter]|uniref:LysR family transcriptional regulator n=1 Tax=Agrobacterium radiobacter TaxID=362 RepID=UPI003F869974
MHSMNNLRGVDLNLLVVLDALLSERHVSRAALRLNMSQPAVSHALARLRVLLEDPLFTRHSGGLSPTIRALELSQPVKEALAQIRAVLGPGGFDPARGRHVFRLAMSDYGASIILPELMSLIGRSAPGIDLSITQLSREGMVAGVVDGDIDLGLGVFPHLPAQIHSELLFSDQYVCLVDRATLPPLADRIDLDAYLARPHALVAVHGEASTEIDETIHTAGFSRRVALVLPHWSVAPNTIIGTNLILTVAAKSLETLRRHKRLVILPSPIEFPPVPFTLISHKRRQADPALRWIRAAISAIAHPVSPGNNQRSRPRARFLAIRDVRSTLTCD